VTAVLSIGMFTYSAKPRGSVVHAASVADALARAGHDVTVYALGQPGAAFYRALECPVRLFPAREAPPDKDALVRQRVSELVAGIEASPLRHDVVHAQDCLVASALLETRASRGIPLVRTVHHVDSFDSAYLSDCQRRSVLCADEVFTVSRLTQREVAASFGRSSRLVPNGVDLARFSGPRRDRSWLEARFGAPSTGDVVLSVGGVEPRKNARRALAAVATVAQRRRLTWVIAGGSSLWDHSEYARGFDADLAGMPEGFRRSVVRTGPIDEGDLTALYRLADVLLFPSTQEGFGLCVLEATAAGAAVVVPRGEPFTEYLDPECAVFVDPTSIDDIARGLGDVMDHPARRAALARGAMRRIRAFTWARSASVHVAHYQALLRGRSQTTSPEELANA
jgi:glycosyltransferase-like protein